MKFISLNLPEGQKSTKLLLMRAGKYFLPWYAELFKRH